LGKGIPFPDLPGVGTGPLVACGKLGFGGLNWLIRKRRLGGCWNFLGFTWIGPTPISFHQGFLGKGIRFGWPTWVKKV